MNKLTLLFFVTGFSLSGIELIANQTVQAIEYQSDEQLCLNAFADVRKDAAEYGLKLSSFDRVNTSKFWSNPPTNNKTLIVLGFKGFNGTKSLPDFFGRKGLKIARKIINSCNGTAAVSLGVAQSDYLATLGVVKGKVVPFTSVHAQLQSGKCKRWGYECY